MTQKKETARLAGSLNYHIYARSAYFFGTGEWRSLLTKWRLFISIGFSRRASAISGRGIVFIEFHFYP